MKKLLLISTAFISFLSKSQDSATAYRHEVGFNTVKLVKQIISNNPSSVLEQSPYLLFYNHYFQSNMAIRLGVGAFMSNQKTKVDGQPEPRTSKSNSISGRLGISRDFEAHKRVTLNAFADATFHSNKLTSVNTTTSQAGLTTRTITVESNTKETAVGLQVGVGLKFNIYRNLSLYAEAPVSFMRIKEKAETENIVDNVSTKSSDESNASAFSINLPATLYLVLRF